MKMTLPAMLSVLLIVCLSGCSDSKELTEIQAACDNSGKYDMKMCRCIAEGAAESEMSEMARQWLVGQLAAPANAPMTVGIAPSLKMVEYMKYLDRIGDPQLFCSDYK